MFGLSKKNSSDDKPGWAGRLRAGLARTRGAIGGGFSSLLGRRGVDETLFEELETALLRADCGVRATESLMKELRDRAKRERIEDGEALRRALGTVLVARLSPLERSLALDGSRPRVILVAGVNGSGKTTTIGKLAHALKSQGRTVLLAAGDTFRAAAREQLETWGQRNDVTVIAQQGGDPGAIAFDAVSAAVARKIDVVIVDTAGRLPTQLHLMDEIRKVKRVISKALRDAPHEILLVLDAGTGQNGLAQVRAFDDAIGLTGLVFTKLDGTAKGGVLAAIAEGRVGPPPGRGATRRDPIPVLYVGVGEGIDDLRPFVAREFVEALVD